MARPRVLLTGFGPFPGVTENPSAWLAETLAERAPSLGLDCELHAAVLPTEWEAVAALAPRLYETLQPRVMIHFGLSERARSFRIERSAYNRALPRADALGKLPASPVILAERPDRLDTGLPAAALTAGLRARGHTAETSRSAGRYLCNFLYYLSLEWAARQESPPLALFMHVPPAASPRRAVQRGCTPARRPGDVAPCPCLCKRARREATPMEDRTGPGFALSEARLNAKEGVSHDRRAQASDARHPWPGRDPRFRPAHGARARGAGPPAALQHLWDRARRRHRPDGKPARGGR